MTTTIHPDVAQGSLAWFDLRRGIITASAIDALITPTLGVAANETSRGLARVLAAERITGRTEPTFTSNDMVRGQLDEPLARALYADTYAPVVEVGFITRDLGDGVVIGYSPDGLVGDDGLIEVKSRKPKEHLRRILDDTVPAENMAQLQCGMFVTGRTWVDYLSYCGGMPMWRKRVTPDAKWFEAIEDAARVFEVQMTTMIDAYRGAVEGLPATEYVDHFADITNY